MSWSVTLTGNSKKLVGDLNNHLNTITDPQSKVEYSEALPILTSLVALNIGDDMKVMRIAANGHGKGITERSCSVTLNDWDVLI
jgi:hypothetical protein